MPDTVLARNWVLVAGGFHRGGGMDSANAALAQYLADRGRRVHLVCHQADDDLRNHAGVEVHQVRRPLRSYFLGQWLIDARGRQIAAKIIGVDGDARVIVNGANCAWPDVNWVHFVQAAWDSSDGAGLARVKNRIDKSVARMREKAALARAKVVIANSNRTRRDLIDLVGIPAERIHTVYLGGESHWKTAGAKARIAAREWLGKNLERTLVAFVGALGTDSRKGFDTMWAAWQRLCANPAWDADLIVAGGGRAYRAWQSRIAASSIANRVKMLGHTDRIAEVLAAADLLVSPVRYEPYGLNVHEALCCGVPAMVSASAGVAEHYPAEMAELLIPNPDDVEGLCARMLAWRRSPSMWKERVQPLARELRRRTWDEMAREIVQIAEQSTPRFSEGSSAR
ncbi:MAG: glycosyltransferase family 4 protein [Candidatus Binatus sp.]|uniref:glycosyltransferase family 4 protein n=1 Tax=Candidatus Binatus sp. TaxID=2811406 RepID=UPI00271EC74C|nr:glycosyltransferase family 4 protein [Candidatus Binatus sp.]MDO8431597.1 glycosyltransferase family 4 protein [Candidatus Binatus sp.]